MCYTPLKVKVRGQLYAILGTTVDGYEVVAVEKCEQHGLMPRPWIVYKPDSVETIAADDVEEYLAYAIGSNASIA